MIQNAGNALSLCSKMAERVENSSLHEVEVESVSAVEFIGDEQVGVVEEMIEEQQMVAFHQISDQIEEEIVLQPQEEIVGEDQSVLVGDDGLVYIDSIPVPAPVPDIHLSSASRTHKIKKSPKKQPGAKNQIVVTSPDQLYSGGASSSDKKWEQKQFQIKTTDGEFSVTMWASGSYCI